MRVETHRREIQSRSWVAKPVFLPVAMWPEHLLRSQGEQGA